MKSDCEGYTNGVPHTCQGQQVCWEIVRIYLVAFRTGLPARECLPAGWHWVP